MSLDKSIAAARGVPEALRAAYVQIYLDVSINLIAAPVPLRHMTNGTPPLTLGTSSTNSPSHSHVPGPRHPNDVARDPTIFSKAFGKYQQDAVILDPLVHLGRSRLGPRRGLSTLASLPTLPSNP